MYYLDLSLPTPAANLALDEALLNACEAGRAAETLVFWESPTPFVVVGYANQLAREVNLLVCAARGIPIFRRCSGGGTIVQMPGGLNYSLLLPITPDGPTAGITSANHFIMERNRRALAALTGLPVAVRGHTDLTVGPRKFAGNAQRRRRGWLLFHGTLLLSAQLDLISELLLMPSQEPDYRQHRPHREFVMNLPATPDQVKHALRTEWLADTPLPHPPFEEIDRLARDQYSTAAWNHKF